MQWTVSNTTLYSIYYILCIFSNSRRPTRARIDSNGPNPILAYFQSDPIRKKSSPFSYSKPCPYIVFLQMLISYMPRCITESDKIHKNQEILRNIFRVTPNLVRRCDFHVFVMSWHDIASICMLNRNTCNSHRRYKFC